MTLPDFADIRVLVVGDIMLDQYWQGPAKRVSPEAPVPVVNVSEQQQRAGGAANVALNALSLGAKVALDGIVGDDEAGEQLRHMLERDGVECCFVADATHATIKKLRILSHNQQLIRLDFESLLHDNDAQLLARYRQKLSQADVVILSDYAKGTLAGVEQFIALARQHQVPVFVDPKGLDFQPYRGATALTPNQAEFEAIVGPCQDDEALCRKGAALCRDLDLQCLLVTLGARGMMLIQPDETAVPIASEAQAVFDVTGAGDTVVAVFALAVAGKNNDFETAARLANTAAGIVVGKVGTDTVRLYELRKAILNADDKLLPEDDLLAVFQHARDAGEKIVMTNGCFDALHAGHVHYLAQARALGDRLLVAVNDDASVQRLKGPGRPLNALADRMQVLAALAAVDWVVPFSEDTPERLISRLLPDVLVKGGDYEVSDIAGHRQVLEAGGEVLTLDYLEGYSTSAMLANARKTSSE